MKKIIKVIFNTKEDADKISKAIEKDLDKVEGLCEACLKGSMFELIGHWNSLSMMEQEFCNLISKKFDGTFSVIGEEKSCHDSVKDDIPLHVKIEKLEDEILEVEERLSDFDELEKYNKLPNSYLHDKKFLEKKLKHLKEELAMLYNVKAFGIDNIVQDSVKDERIPHFFLNTDMYANLIERRKFKIYDLKTDIGNSYTNEYKATFVAGTEYSDKRFVLTVMFKKFGEEWKKKVTFVSDFGINTVVNDYRHLDKLFTDFDDDCYELQKGQEYNARYGEKKEPVADSKEFPLTKEMIDAVIVDDYDIVEKDYEQATIRIPYVEIYIKGNKQPIELEFKDLQASGVPGEYEYIQGKAATYDKPADGGYVEGNTEAYMNTKFTAEDLKKELAKTNVDLTDADLEVIAEAISSAIAGIYVDLEDEIIDHMLNLGG